MNNLKKSANSASALPFPGQKFDADVILKQSNRNSQWMLWLLMGSTLAGMIWASVAKIEEAIPAQGKLEPQGQVKNLQVPVNGVIKKIHIADGQVVKAGDVLLEVDPEAPQAQLKSLKEVLSALEQENWFYNTQMAGSLVGETALKIDLQMLSLTKSRAALVAENRLFEAQFNGSIGQTALSSQEQARLQAEQAEASSRAMAVRLEVDQLQQQWNAAEERRKNALTNLQVEDKILQDIKPLAEAGGISRVQYLKQQQTVDNKNSEITQLEQEKARINAVIAQAQVKVTNNSAVDRKDFSSRINLNSQKIAEIDGQLSKVIVENNKKIAEINGQITQALQSLKYSMIKAPVSGTVFNLKATSPGYVATPTESILTIVPNDSLVAKVMITNRDIGFIRNGMAVDVRIDSFPFSEFGDVKGEIISIASDALPPTQLQPYYTFPVMIKLARQSLGANGRDIRLQSGMSLSANIRVRERTVMSVFTDTFTKASESLKFVR